MTMDEMKALQSLFEEKEGVLPFLPNFIPRSFAQPGTRLRLHPDDYYPLGLERGAIKERWFVSTVPALNGPLAPADEGLSYIPLANGGKIAFRDAVAGLGARLVGREVWQQYGTWPMFAKFFDNETPLFLHLHLCQKDAEAIGMNGKPEAYFFPHQYNATQGRFPHTYFGFDPDVTREEVRARMLHYREEDTRITELSRAFRLQLDTGWYVPPGVVHAPGSLLTYEPQWNSDVNSIYENVTAGEVNPYSQFSGCAPEDKKEDIDYLLGYLDWEKNTDPHFRKHYFRPPLLCRTGEGFTEEWIAYGNPFFCATRLTVQPGASVCVADPAAYGCILIEGYGRLGAFACETPHVIRYGRPTADEFFVSAPAAQRGVTIANASACEPLVLLKHFALHPDAPRQ